jgi:hypothetical protein
MVRALSVGTVIVGVFLVGWSRPWTQTDACTLLTPVEASALQGSALVLNHTESNSAFSTCIYAPSKDPGSPWAKHVEIHYWVFADVTAAQAKFQRVVHPGPMAGTTVTAVQQLGDEGDIKRTPSYTTNSVEFRRGTSIVTIGVNPIVSDSALLTAARKALSRL